MSPISPRVIAAGVALKLLIDTLLLVMTFTDDGPLIVPLSILDTDLYKV